MQLKKQFILGIAALVLFSSIGVAPVVAQPAPQIPPIIQACQDEHTEFKETQPFADLVSGNLNSPGKFLTFFEAAQKRYHLYMECIFDQSVQQILSSSGANTDGFWTANSPNIPELLVPDMACLEPAELKAITLNTGTDTLLPYLLKAYNQYTAVLKSTVPKFKSDLSIDYLEKAAVWAREAERLAINEAEDSLTALHTALAELTELRQVFIMHVQFQCMLKNLEAYRTFLGEIRKVILLLPARIIDASTVR